MPVKKEFYTDIVGTVTETGLSVLSVANPDDRPCSNGKAKYNVKCHCGKHFVTTRRSLMGYKLKSCGCVAVKKMREQYTTHAEGKTRLYRVWSQMRQRCSNKNDSGYKNYGGRGIVVCDEWEKWETFRDWSLANGYAQGLTIDRENNDLNYEPSNCRWITRAAQVNNRRITISIEYNGHVKPLSEWCRALGVGYFMVRNRIKSNWTFEDAITKPLDLSKVRNRKRA
jgi:hypothetical protein